jgi:hypothetical protein
MIGGLGRGNVLECERVDGWAIATDGGEGVTARVDKYVEGGVAGGNRGEGWVADRVIGCMGLDEDSAG